MMEQYPKVWDESSGNNQRTSSRVDVYHGVGGGCDGVGGPPQLCQAMCCTVCRRNRDADAVIRARVCDKQTDRQTDGTSEFTSPDLVSHPSQTLPPDSPEDGDFISYLCMPLDKPGVLRYMDSWSFLCKTPTELPRKNVSHLPEYFSLIV